MSNVAAFIYLGLKIDAKGSLQNSFNFLSEKAMRACFALNKQMKIKRIPVNVALRLFDACILPFLTYAAEVWQDLRGLILTHREANEWQHMDTTYFRILLMVLMGRPIRRW